MLFAAIDLRPKVFDNDCGFNTQNPISQEFVTVISHRRHGERHGRAPNAGSTSARGSEAVHLIGNLAAHRHLDADAAALQEDVSGPHSIGWHRSEATLSGACPAGL